MFEERISGYITLLTCFAAPCFEKEIEEGVLFTTSYVYKLSPGNIISNASFATAKYHAHTVLVSSTQPVRRQMLNITNKQARSMSYLAAKDAVRRTTNLTAIN